MKCSACSAELPDTAKFCPECGEKIVRKTVCPVCGTEAAPGAKFCVECGHKFAAAPAPAVLRDALLAGGKQYDHPLLEVREKPEKI